MPNAEEKILMVAELNSAEALASMQALAAQYKAMLQTMGDSPEIAKQVAALEAWQAQAAATAESLKTASAAAPGVQEAGAAADQAAPKFDASRRAVAMLGAELANVMHVSPMAGSAISQFAFGAISPATLAIMAAAAAIATVVKLFGDAERKARESGDAIVQAFEREASAVERLAESYRDLDKAKGAPQAPPGFGAAEDVLRVIMQTGLSEAQAEDVVTRSIAAGFAGDLDAMMAFGAAVAGGMKPEEAPAFAARLRREGLPSLERQYGPAGDTLRQSEVGSLRAARAGAQYATARQTPEERLKAFARLRGLADADVEHALGRFGIGEALWGGISFFWTHKMAQDVTNEILRDPRMIAAQQDVGVTINGGQIVIQPQVRELSFGPRNYDH